jgi:hypothetical protein
MSERRETYKRQRRETYERQRRKTYRERRQAGKLTKREERERHTHLNKIL